MVQRSAGGGKWTWKKVTVVVDSGAAENVMPKSMFPAISTEDTETTKNGKGFKRTEGEHIKNMDSRSCPSELLRSLYARARDKLQM